METKAYLNQLTNIDRRIKDKVKESQKWLDIAISRSIGSGGGSDDVKVQTSHNPDKIADAIVKAVDYQREAEKIALELTQKKHTIQRQIDGIEDELFYNILHGYYVEGKSINQLSYQEGYSYKNIKRKYDMAINTFENQYGNTYL